MIISHCVFLDLCIWCAMDKYSRKKGVAHLHSSVYTWQCSESHVYIFLVLKDDDIDEDVMHRISAGWLKWRQASGVLYDIRDAN